MGIVLRQRLLTVALVVGALVILVSALAYQTASVTNPTSFVVDTTGNAALAMAPGTTPDTGVTVSVAGRRLSITINDKLQPGSVYKFSDVFKITNTGPAGGSPYAAVNLSHTAADGWPAGVTLAAFQTGTANDLSTVTLNNTTQTSVEVDLQLTVDGAYAGTGGSFGINVVGSR